ncbi:MAG: hypothetical protein WBQ03_04385 [Candidatus Sulfotelmatobacter sp.]
MIQEGSQEWDNGNKKFNISAGFKTSDDINHQTLILPFGGHSYLVTVNRSFNTGSADAV